LIMIAKSAKQTSNKDCQHPFYSNQIHKLNIIIIVNNLKWEKSSEVADEARDLSSSPTLPAASALWA
jgi:hypothetical protein